MLMYYLFPKEFPRLALYCLAHDVPEAWVGDIPSPTLRYTPGLATALSDVEARLNNLIGLPSESALSELDLQKLKACDRLEFYLWAREQVAMGNRFAQEGLTEIMRHFDESPLPKQAQEFFEYIRKNPILPKQQGIMKGLFNASK
jgi:5'-deoxynucleotidase YfbR-like HD superfamily hydrolase